MANNGDDDNLLGTPVSSNPNPSPNPNPGPKHDNKNDPIAPDLLIKSPSPQDFILSVASKIVSQPLQYSDPDVWGVLTAISTKARQRRQGINMLLISDEHIIGRTVADTGFQILSNQVSQHHCKIYRKKVAAEDADGQSRHYTCVFLRDTSTNGTYLNWEKLNKNSPEYKLHHGDIISFAAPPYHEIAFAFVFREVFKPTSSLDSSPLKRKADEFGSETKRLRGIGIGASEGPISLDDFRSLQWSNTELRKQLEDHVATIDHLRNVHYAVIELLEVEKKNLKESIAKTYVDEHKEIHDLFEAKQKELVEVQKITSEQKHAIVDLNERLNASMQTCTEANEIMCSQNASISELKVLIDEEREQRKEDREKAVATLTDSIQRVKLEAQEELKRLSDASLRREKEQQEIINKLQEDTRQKLVGSDNKVRQLESHLCQEQHVSSIGKKKVQDLEHEISRLKKEFESEKAAREEAWAKVSTLELEINAAMRDLEYEKRRLKAARDRIMLRETQLRAFYSTTEEISILFAKQQEQLKTMQRTLEDEENYENISFDINPNIDNGNQIGSLHHSKEALVSQCSGGMKAADSSTSTKREGGNQVKTSSDEVSVTEMHECDAWNQETCEETQEAEFASFDPGVKGAFGSDIEGVNTAPIGTEQVLETETQGLDQNIYLSKLAGDTMMIDDDDERVNLDGGGENVHQLKDLVEENTEAGDTIRTADLLASEIVGSWACSTAPSCNGENDTPGSGDYDKGASGGGGGDGSLNLLASVALESQSGVGRNPELEALTKMIGIVASEMKSQFRGTIESDSEKAIASNSDTEDCTECDCDSDVETQAHHNSSKNNHKTVEAMDEDNDDDEANQSDSTTRSNSRYSMAEKNPNQSPQHSNDSVDRPITHSQAITSQLQRPFTPNEILPRTFWLDLKPNNFHLDIALFKSTNNVMVEILKGHPIYPALSIAESVPQIYLQQFWLHLKFVPEAGHYHFERKIDAHDVAINLTQFRNTLRLPKQTSFPSKQKFDDWVSDEELRTDILRLGYDGPLEMLSHFKTAHLQGHWYFLFNIINKCLTGKSAGYDTGSVAVLRMFHAVAFNRHLDYAMIIWNDLKDAVEDKAKPKKARKYIPYQRFLQLLIHRAMSEGDEITKSQDLMHV